jgi:hypothetical protein
MSSIGYRDWEIWINKTLLDDLGDARGVYLIKVEPLLMAKQTVQFIYEKIEDIRHHREAILNNQAKDYFSLFHWTPQELVLQKVAELSSHDNIQDKIAEILHELDALSLCLDFPLSCNYIEFFIPPTQPLAGKVIVASRRNISRGVSFEVEERGMAFQKILKDYDFFLGVTRDLKVVSRHYINGLTLLGLEDSYSGLLDAAFMQFYQACEILSGNNYQLSLAQQHVATLNLPDQDTVQIILHHVWQIRHNYFGHGNINNWLYAPDLSESVFRIAKQVLVARWLCRILLDSSSPSGLTLCREMRLYHKQISDGFFGTVQELETSFRVDYSNRTVKIKDSSGKTVKQYVIK